MSRKDVEFPRSPGHFEEWVAAIKGGAPAMSNFPDYAGPLAETVLAGNLAVWLADQKGAGPKVEWDAQQLKAEESCAGSGRSDQTHVSPGLHALNGRARM